MAARDFGISPHSPLLVSSSPAVAAIQPERNRDSHAEQLAALRLEFAEVYRELYEAAQMQRKLSGPRLLRRGQFEIASEIFPVRHLSGDFFNVSDLEQAALLAVGDIEGKGLLAGMWFTQMLSMTRMYGNQVDDPAIALSIVNRLLCTEQPGPPLTSIFLARLDFVRGRLLYSNAGHPAPVLLRADGTMEFLRDGGPVLGAVTGAKFASTCVKLRAGDTLVAYSDGLLECRNEHDEEFGIDRLIGEVVKARNSSITGLLFSLIGAAQDFAGTHAREDDCTLMVVRCQDPSKACAA